MSRVSRERLELMLAEDDPGFENWDQDAAALAGRCRFLHDLEHHLHGVGA